jgi:hypothetical protein
MREPIIDAADEVAVAARQLTTLLVTLNRVARRVDLLVSLVGGTVLREKEEPTHAK